MGANKLTKIGCPGIEKFPLDQLHPAEYNPRVISDEALKGLMHSIKRFGLVEPIVVNTRRKQNIIIAGHQRFRILQSLDARECLCVTVNYNKTDERLLNVTLNNPEIQGRFVERMAEYIEGLRADLPDDRDFLNLRIVELQKELGYVPEKSGNILDDDIPKIPKKAITCAGDLWILGKHRLICGDSTKEADVTRLMNNEKASLFATDPPYCVNYTGNERPKKGKDWSDLFHDLKIEDAHKFVKAFYTIGLKHIKKKTALYLWHASKQKARIEDVCNELGILIHQQIIWVKPCMIMGYSFYAWQHEPCLLMWKRGQVPSHTGKGNSIGTVWPVGYIKSGDPTKPEYYTDVWELDYDGKKRPTGIEHPTVKPVEVFAIPMRIHTKEGDICYEPFCGSGTQVIAAEKLNRRCYAMEKVPVFVDVAVERWQQWTGKKAKLEKRARSRRPISDKPAIKAKRTR